MRNVRVIQKSRTNVGWFKLVQAGEFFGAWIDDERKGFTNEKAARAYLNDEWIKRGAVKV